MLLLDKADLPKLHTIYEVKKFDMTSLRDLATVEEIAALSAEAQLDLLVAQGLKPYDTHEGEWNLLMYQGASDFFDRLIGTSVTVYDNTNAYLGVGDSTTAAAATQTDLQAATNKLRKAMDASYPSHTSGATSGNASCIWRSTFATSDANYAWQEWGLFNASSAGHMLNRKVESLGTKTSAASWQFTVTLSLA